ncbi:MAG: DUF2849 domain-containing protein [Hyphomicrobiaceae bacterium]
MTKVFKPKIVSANDLFDGDVVYLDGDSNWTRRISEAAVATSVDAADALLAESDQPAKIVGPYLLDVKLDDDTVEPDHFRERLRDTGPTFSAEFIRSAHVDVLDENATTQGKL